MTEEGVGQLALAHVAMLAARRDPAVLLAHSATLKKRFKTVRSRPQAVTGSRSCHGWLTNV